MMTRKEKATFLYMLHQELKFTALGSSFVRLKNGDLDVLENGGVHVLYLNEDKTPSSYIYTTSVTGFDKNWLIEGSVGDGVGDSFDETEKIGFVCNEHLLQALKYNNFEYGISEFLFINKIHDYGDEYQKSSFNMLISILESKNKDN